MIPLPGGKILGKRGDAQNPRGHGNESEKFSGERVPAHRKEKCTEET